MFRSSSRIPITLKVSKRATAVIEIDITSVKCLLSRIIVFLRGRSLWLGSRPLLV
jgi:hypothetical protein